MKNMTDRFLYFAAFAVLCVFGCGQLAADVIYPVSDGEVVNEFHSGNVYADGVDGQWWPRVSWTSDPEWETQVVMEFDLSGSAGVSYDEATFNFYVGGISDFDELVLEICGSDGDGEVTASDWESGSLIDTFGWVSPSPGSGEIMLEQWVSIDVTDLVNNRTSDYVSLNIRLPGNGFEGCVFSPSSVFHTVDIAASENFDLMPSIELTVPEPATIMLLAMGAAIALGKRRS